MKNKLKIFSGRSNPELALKIANSAKCELGNISIKTFSDGELWVKYEENIRGHDVFLIQSTNGPAENILEIALMADAAVRASAERVSVIIPYFGYARQDRKVVPRTAISAKSFCDCQTSAKNSFSAAASSRSFFKFGVSELSLLSSGRYLR